MIFMSRLDYSKHQMTNDKKAYDYYMSISTQNLSNKKMKCLASSRVCCNMN